MKKIAVLIIFFSAKSFSQNFYVDKANGNDSNTGTSVNQAWKTIQNAFDNATPGSTVLIRGGTYNENLSANVSGTAGNVITFRNYPNEPVFLDGTGTPQAELLYIENQSYLVIENITIRNKTVNNAAGVTVSCTANGSVSGITLKNLKISGINWTSNPNAIPTSNNNSHPLLVYGSGTNQVNAITNIVIDSCEVYNNITGFSEAISLDGNVDGFTVSNNNVHDNKNIGILMGGNYNVSSNPLNDHARNGRCFQNTCYNNVSLYATSAGIYVDGGMDIVVERNTSCANGFGIEIGCEENGTTSGIIVRDNVFYNNKEAGLALGGYTTATTGQVLNSSVLNNTFLKNDYSNSGTGEIYMTKMSSCKIQNNIIYTNSQNILISRDNITPFSNNSINHNCWYTPGNNSNSITVNWGTGTYTSFSMYQSQTGQDVNSMYADPLLTSAGTTLPDFHLLSASPCMDAGDPAFTAGANETDFYGGSRIINSTVDIGAHESPAVTPVNEEKNETGVSFFPNPSFNKRFTIYVSNFPVQLQVYDLSGRLVLENILNNTENPVWLDKEANGMYFCKIIFPDGVSHSQKIILR